MKYKVLILLILAALLLGGCAETKTAGYQSPDPMVDLANTCAMCGASVNSNYLFGTGMRAVGPGNY